MDRDIDLFFIISQIITGDDELPQKLKEQYYNRIYSHYKQDLATIIEKFRFDILQAKPEEYENRFRIAIFDKATPKELNLIKQIALIWYTAQFYTAEADILPAESVEQYKLQRMYPLIQAPVKAYANHIEESNFEFSYGYWSNCPDNKEHL